MAVANWPLDPFSLPNCFRLQAHKLSVSVKQFFFRQLTGVHFEIYAPTLNKERLYPSLCRW